MKTKSYFLSLVLIFLIVNLPIFACKQAWDLPPDTVHTVAKIANRAYDDTHYSSGGAIVHAIRETFVGHEWDKYLFSGSTGHYMFEGGIRHTFGAVSYAPDCGTVVSIHGSLFLYDWITNFDFS